MEPGTEVIVWRPKGVGDALDADQNFPGSMQSLQNLIPNPSTTNQWVCRPAAVKIGDFATSVSPSFPGVTEISVALIVGTMMYGMVRTTLNSGFDQPFAYNLSTQAFVTVTGITAGTVPAQVPRTGSWVPPTMDVVGSKVLVTHPGFGSTANFFGWFDISTPTAPVWHAGNLTGAINFTTVPTFVAQFFNRAYWIVNGTAQPSVVFTDVLNPLNVTNANQALTFNDNTPLTALGQLRMRNMITGVVQALIVFKGVSNMFQITGDAALNTLAINALNVATGTLSPRGICPTPKGLAFVSPDGVRLVSFDGTVSDPIGIYGEGISVPFVSSVVVSRIAATCGTNIMRISTQNGAAVNTPQQEFWYHITSNQWSGPHTFNASWIAPYQNTFIMAPFGVQGIWQSDPVQNNTSVFVENGVQMAWNYQTTTLPDNEQATNGRIIKSSIDLQFSPTAPPITAVAVDPNGQVFGSVSLVLPGSASMWGGFTWGTGVWGQGLTQLTQRQIPWTAPIVFTDIAFQLQGQSSSAHIIGALRMRYKVLKYLVDIGATG